MHDFLICEVLQHAGLNDILDTALEDELRRVLAIDAEIPLDVQSLQLS